MTGDEIQSLWRDAEVALHANRLEDAERSATALVEALERSQPTLELPPPLSYGFALGVLANVRLNRSGAQAAVDVFESALKCIKQDPPGVRRGLVWVNFARLFEYLGRANDAASAAGTAIYEVDSQARTLDAAALSVLFESVDMLHTLRAGSEIVLTSLRGVLEAAESATPKSAKVLVRVHENLMKMLFALERYTDALPHAEFMVRLQSARFGESSTEAGDARVSYGFALDMTGDYKGAELYYRRALEDLRRHRGEGHDSVTQVRQNLAELARIRGNFDEAERQFRTLEAEDQARHPNMGDRNSQLLINFGLTLIALTRYDEAAEKLHAAMEIRAAHDGINSPRYARVLLSLGQLAGQRGRLDEAATMLEQAATIYNNVGDAASADYALFEAGLVAIRLAKSVAAGRHPREMIAKAQTRLGEHHPEVVYMLIELIQNEVQALAKAGWAGPLRNQVRRHLEEVDDLGRFELVNMLSSLGEQSLRATLNQRRTLQVLHLSLIMSEERSRPVVDRAWRFVTRYRGAETTALRLRARRYIQYDPSGKRARIAQIKARLVEVDIDLARNKNDQQLTSERWRLVDELADLEFLLASGTCQQRLDFEFIGQEPPRLHMQADSAVLTVSKYHRLPDRTESYAVFVVKGDNTVHLVDLGAAGPIDDAITQYRQAVIVEGLRAFPNENTWRDPGLWLGTHVLNVLRPYLDGVRQLRVLADGALALLPLSTLPKLGGGFVLDDFDITYDVSLSGLRGVVYEEDTGIDAPPFVIGAPQYTTGQSRQRAPAEETEFLAQFRSGGRFDPLPHAEEECRVISQLLQVSPLLGRDATKAALMSLRSPEVLHVCAHGFHLSGRKTEQIDGSGFGLGARSSLTDSLNRAGLALAGANDYLDGRLTPPDVADGILYGAEIADCDFMRTDLVTLSACQTGLGDVAQGDGVHGLQRAFLSAGARTVVCSLWEVPDAPTRQMFTSFYTRVLGGEPRGSAFHQSVRELAARYPHHPVAWGGFILLGHTGPLARFTISKMSVSSIWWPKSDDADLRSPASQAEELIVRAQQEADAGDVDDGLATLKTGLEIGGVPSALIVHMMYTAAGIQRQAGRYDDAARAYADLELRPDLPHGLRLATVFDAGTNYLIRGDWLQAVERYSSFLALKPALDDAAKALVNRAAAYFELDDVEHCLADLAAVIDGSTMPPVQRAKALVNRAALRLHQGDIASALSDAHRVLYLSSNAAPDEVASAYVIKGLAAQSEGRSGEALEYFKRARELPDITPRMARMAEQQLSHIVDM